MRDRRPAHPLVAWPLVALFAGCGGRVADAATTERSELRSNEPAEYGCGEPGSTADAICIDAPGTLIPHGRFSQAFVDDDRNDAFGDQPRFAFTPADEPPPPRPRSRCVAAELDTADSVADFFLCFRGMPETGSRRFVFDPPEGDGWDHALDEGHASFSRLQHLHDGSYVWSAVIWFADDGTLDCSTSCGTLVCRFDGVSNIDGWGRTRSSASGWFQVSWPQ